MISIYTKVKQMILTHINLGVSAGVVIKMASSLPARHNFKLFADNCFTSLPLVQELKKT